MNVLSLFDGMSCGQIATERIGLPVENYFASEIDKYAIKVTQANYPNTIQLGDVQNWKSWKLPKIDLLIAGSPCQGFSLAGKGLNFDDPRSRLFFVFLEIRDELLHRNPNMKWMLENVKMKKEWSSKITELVGVEPVLINSALVSAQSRQRLYWANFPITTPEDRGILLKDIIEDGDVDRDKSFCVDANYFKGGNPKRYTTKSSRQLVKLPDKNRSVRSGGRGSLDRHSWDMIQVGSIYSNNADAGRIYSAEGKARTLKGEGGGGGAKMGLYAIQGTALRNQAVFTIASSSSSHPHHPAT